MAVLSKSRTRTIPEVLQQLGFTLPQPRSHGQPFLLHAGGNKLFARSGLVGVNQLCSLKLPQSPRRQGNGGRNAKEFARGLRVCGHEEREKWLKLTD